MPIAAVFGKEYQEVMRHWGIAGRLLVVLGVIGLAYPSFDYSAVLSSLADSEPLPKSVIPDQPAVYWAFIGVGVGLMVFGVIKRFKRA